jgi:hypothetical protein
MMRKITISRSLSRREFVRDALRGSVLVILTGVVALAVRGRGVTMVAGCVADGACAGCALYARCELPPAVAVRTTVDQKEGTR